MNGFDRRQFSFALGLQREIDHQNGVFLDDADKQDYADQGDDAEVQMEKTESEQGADAGRRQRRKNRNRMNVALIQDAENDVNDDDRRQQKYRLGRKRSLEGLSRTLKRGMNCGRHSDLPLHVLNITDGIAKRRVRREIEGKRDRRKNTLMIHRQGAVGI